MFTMRFDMRAPSTPTTELYSAALEMAAFAETRGAVAAVICEHHASPDGYLPSPLLLASAMAARTTRLRIAVAAVILPFTDPVRLAEEMNVLDIISEGRVSYTCGIGYRREEFEQFGVDRSQRGRIAEEKLQVLLRAKTGEPFEQDGRRIHVTPAPVTPGGPKVAWGGGSLAAARRAGRYGLDFAPAKNDSEFLAVYEAEARKHGHVPGNVRQAEPGSATAAFVADDVDRAWDEIGPHLLHDVITYGEWNEVVEHTANVSFAKSLDEVRREKGTHQILSVDEAVDIVRAGSSLRLHPLCGGLPPKLAWPYLERVTDEVVPAARD
jgi:alkanesulfonate monooxygenase SsuD/methylene tetrahydromethanopterin reductase-like flavin-dependent oxidoreductase (luciferase family)